MPHHTLIAPDGWRLHIRELAPPPSTPTRGVVIASHAMMVNGRTFVAERRPSLAGALASAGFHVLIPDLRGHGESRVGPLGARAWRYDDIVTDTALYIDLAAERAQGRPIVTLGHSLGGHTTLAWLGMNPEAPVAAHVMIAVHLWGQAFTASAARHRLQRSTLHLSTAIARLVGRFPTRALRLGHDDESLAYWESLHRVTMTSRWVSDDGALDYLQLASQARCPVLHVVSDGDRIVAPPDDALTFSARAFPGREVLRVRGGEPGGPAEAPGHIGIVTDPAAAPVWARVVAWIERNIPAGQAR